MIEKYFAKVIMDDLNDTEMIFDYAEKAKEEREPEASAFFLNRAKKRMTEFAEDMAHMSKCAKGDAWEVYTDFANEKAEKLQHEIDRFTP